MQNGHKEMKMTTKMQNNRKRVQAQGPCIRGLLTFLVEESIKQLQKDSSLLPTPPMPIQKILKPPLSRNRVFLTITKE